MPPPSFIVVICTFVTAAALLQPVASIPVDNGVEGEPEIECGPTSVSVSFNTRNPFEGHVYVKGLYAQAGCRVDGNGQQRTGSISLPFDQCNVQRTRSLNPNGIFIGTTVIISFHPKFETKVDKAYKIQCFYMEAAKTVGTELEVSMLTTVIQTQNVPMPVCRYQILNGGPNGQPVKFAIVGQSVYHKWTCDTETVNTFCMRVYGCYVDDGHGDRVDLLDEKGCAVDRFLLNNLEYPTDLMAGKEANTFKYADRIALFFQCQIQITLKDGGECAHPQCPEPAKGKKRSVSHGTSSERFEEPLVPAAVMDVATDLTALESDDHRSTSAENAAISRFLSGSSQHDICMSGLTFGLFSGFVVILVISACVVMTLLCLRRKADEKP